MYIGLEDIWSLKCGQRWGPTPTYRVDNLGDTCVSVIYQLHPGCRPTLNEFRLVMDKKHRYI